MEYLHYKLYLHFMFQNIFVSKYLKGTCVYCQDKFGFHIDKFLNVKEMFFLMYRHREHGGAPPIWK